MRSIRKAFLSSVIALLSVLMIKPVMASGSVYDAMLLYYNYAGFSIVNKDGQFSLLYLNNNAVPDFIYKAPGFCIVYVDGQPGILDGYRNFYLENENSSFNFSYYPKKSLLIINDSNESGVFGDNYYRLTSVGNGFTDLWQILHVDSTKLFQGCTQNSRTSSGKTYGSYWDSEMNKWIVRYAISWDKFYSVLNKLVGTTDEKACTFYRNTETNIEKYLNPEPYAPASVKLNKTSASLRVGQSMTLSATVTGKSKTVAWSSSNTGVATVSSTGKVSAKKTGKTTITAKANGKTASCTITVTSAKELSYYKGKKLGLAIQAFPNGYRDYKYGIMYWRYQGVHFHGNGEYVPMNDVIISYVSLQGSTNYTLGGMKPGISRAKALQTVTGNGWKFNKRVNNLGGEDLVYGPKNGKYIELYFENGILDTISYY